jgi:hypothetical protein
MTKAQHEFERKFLLDYMWFGRTILALQSRVLNDAFNTETDDDCKRAYVLAIHTNLMQECEHVAAWLLAFRRFAAAKTPLLDTLLEYQPGDARLKDVLKDVTSPEKIQTVFGITPETFVPSIMPKDAFEARLADIWKGLMYYAEEQKQRLPLSARGESQTGW